MDMTNATRRGFLKIACMVTGSMFIGLHMANAAKAAVQDLKTSMMARIHGVYKADSDFKKRASQDNEQVKELYAQYLGEPLGEQAEQLLHTHWTDRSSGLENLIISGKYPHSRHVEFVQNSTKYPYEE